MQKTYETYKDSGIEWIGNVPSHWEVFPMKYKVNLYNGNSIKDDEKPLYEDDSDAIPYIATKDVNVDNHSIDYENGMYVKNLDHSFVRAPKGSSLMCIEGGSAGRKIGITNQEVAFINKLCCFTTKDISILDNLYLYFYLQSSTFKNKFTSHLSGLIGGVSISEMKNFEMICPPLFEQQAIAEYLDKNCSKIDALIAELEQQVTDLGTMKKAEISRIVTKGLNPDAPLKDSGIEWIGEVPSHWEIVRLGQYTSKIGSGITPRGGSETYVDSGIPLLRSQNILFEGIDISDVAYITNEVDESMRGSRVLPGDVLLNITGASIGRCYYVLESFGPANVNQHVCIIRPNGLDTRYLYYTLSSECCQTQIKVLQTGGNREGLTGLALKSFRIPLPDKDEQIRISDFLDTYCAKVDVTVKELQAQIADLKLYKQSIISEAVTGKIKVID